MAYQFVHELTNTIRESPGRAALAAVLLITTSIYVCVGHQEYRVAEVGDASSPEEIVDLTANPEWSTGVEQVAADDDNAPATITRVGSRDRYIDAQLTHAVAVEEDSDKGSLRHVEQISGQAMQQNSGQGPVWLLGVLMDD